MKLPAAPPPEAVTTIVDTREQTPLDLALLRTMAGTLATGDYSILGLESVIALERKSLPDLLACCGVERERFDREINRPARSWSPASTTGRPIAIQPSKLPTTEQRLLAYPVRALHIEATWADVERGGFPE